MNKALKIILPLLVLGAGWYAFQLWYAPYKEATSFDKKLDPYGKKDLKLPQAEGVNEGEIYRTGRVLVVIPERQFSAHSIVETMIHDAWYDLPDHVRARKPSEVDTVIRVFRDSAKGRMYLKQDATELKYVAKSNVYLHVYDWRNQVFIGTSVLDPGDFKGDVMEGKELDEMKDKVSVKAIANHIARLPVRH